MREHVHRLHGNDLISDVEQLKVASLRGRVARDIDDTAGTGIEDDVHHIGMHAGTRWVSDDNVGAPVFRDEVVGENLTHVTGKELCVRDVIDATVNLRILNGFGHIFYSDNLTRLVTCHIVGYGTRSCIEVVDERLF